MTRPDHIVDDLRDEIKGDVSADPIVRALFASDASLFRRMPAVVVRPRSATEVAAVVRYASESGLSIHARGAGTGLAGESLGSGIVIDFSALNRIVEIGDHSIRVEPGVRCLDIQAALHARGRMFPPDPLSAASCTVGGMLATDAGGPHSVRYGGTRDYVRRLRIVLPDGSLAEVGRESLQSVIHHPLLASVTETLLQSLHECSADIEREQPAFARKCGGYHLRGVLQQNMLDFPRLIVGSEGTLALIVEADLNTLPLPAHRNLALVAFSSVESALDAGIAALETLPTACELMDRRLCTVARAGSPRFQRLLPDEAEAVLFVEQEGATPANAQARIELAGAKMMPFGASIRYLREPEEIELAWKTLRDATPKLARTDWGAPPLDFIENVAVPVHRLGDLLRGMQAIMRSHGLSSTYSARIGVGILRVRPLVDVRRTDLTELLQTVMDRVFELVQSMNGTIHAEHGTGLLRSSFVRRSFPKLYPVFQRIKSSFDPKGVFNPGHIVGSAPTPVWTDLRLGFGSGHSTLDVIEPEHHEPAVQADRCNGCGSCRTIVANQRMCPRFKADSLEAAAPRSKAILFREAVQGLLDGVVPSSDELRTVADFCIDCRMCRFECPSNVDIASIARSIKSAHVAEHGLPHSSRFFAHLHAWAEWASGKHRMVNFLIHRGLFRWLAERTWGISRHRRLPPLAKVEFLRWAKDAGHSNETPHDGRPRVALFVDTYVRFHDPRVGIAAVRVLSQLGFAVHVPSQQTQSGMAPLHYGDEESARLAIRANLDVLAPLVREGHAIVCLEPSSALILRQDALSLMNDEEAHIVAASTFEFCEFLGEHAELLESALAQVGETTAQSSLPLGGTIAYHEPCHQKALEPKHPTMEVLQHIPGPTWLPVELGCTGMAGTFGMSANGYHPSMRAGKALFDRISMPDVDYGATQCSTCRLQLEHATKKQVLHPAIWHALALGVGADLVTLKQRKSTK